MDAMKTKLISVLEECVLILLAIFVFMGQKGCLGKEIVLHDKSMRTYMNLDYHFVIDYPKDWELHETGGDIQIVAFYEKIPPPPQPKDPNIAFVHIGMVENTLELPMEEWLEEEGIDKEQPQEEISLRGVKGIKKTMYEHPKRIGVFLPDNGHVYRIIFCYPYSFEKAKPEEYTAIFNDMLRSFRFIDD